MVKLTLRVNESVQEAVRRFRKLVERSGLKREMRRREHYDRFEVTELAPRQDGTVHPDDLAAALRDDTVLVSVMHGNNEIGTVQPIAELAAVAHARGALFHTDAAQTLGKIDFNVAALGVDAASFSGHKIYAPKGTGVLYLKGGTRMTPYLTGARPKPAAPAAPARRTCPATWPSPRHWSSWTPSAPPRAHAWRPCATGS